VYQGRADARTQCRFQFEDGDEYDIKFDHIMRDHNLLNNAEPGRAIVIPYDRGENGRLGEIIGAATRASMQDDEEGEDSESDEDNNGNDEDISNNNADEEFNLGSDEDTQIPIADVVDDFDILNFLGGIVSPGGAVNVVTHIIRMLSDNKGRSSNRGVMECFHRERATFVANLPKTWETMLKLLGVPFLASVQRHMCPNGHHVLRFLSEDMYECHKEDTCVVCNAARCHKATLIK
jgi:hypothetical protein